MGSPAVEGPVLGIDFGTTNTAAAWVDEQNKLQLVRLSDDAFTMPTIAWYGGGERLLVGRGARQMLLDDPAQTVFGAKRFIGRRFQTPYVNRHRDQVAFRLCEGPDGFTAVEVGGRVRPLEVVAEDILRRLLELARGGAKRTFPSCVLTVPAHFGIPQRDVLRRAAERAGVRVAALVNEPTAAAMYYAKATGDAPMVLVFDLGGGTFDATLMTIEQGVVRVVAAGGDAFLGGQDFDSAIARSLLEGFEREHRLDVPTDPVAAQRVALAAEVAKIQLSQHETAAVRVPCVTIHDDQFLDLDVELTRKQVEQMCAPLIERCLGVCEDLLGSRGLAPADVEAVVFVGGMTKMPAIRRRMGQIFKDRDAGPPKGRPLHPDLGVAVGAAILGQQLWRRGTRDLVDVVSVPLGIAIPQNPPLEIIAANTPVPCRRAVRLPRPPPGAVLSLAVFEALSKTAADRELLGIARVGPAWLGRNPGDLLFEMQLGPDFHLESFISTDGGERLAVPLLPPEVVAPRAP